MKKTGLTILGSFMMMIAATATINAQSNKEEIEYFQAIYGMEKKAVIADFLSISPENPFWTIYDEYETKRNELGKERINILDNYVENYDLLDDVDYDNTVANMKAIRKKTDKLIDDYYKKVKKASGSKIAAQFYQLEEYFLAEIRAAIMEGIPYIGEYDW